MDTTRTGRSGDPQPSFRFCTSCGQPAAAGSFCAHCGTPLSAPLGPADTVALPRVPGQPVAPSREADPAPAEATAEHVRQDDDRGVAAPIAQQQPETLGLAWQDEEDEVARPRRSLTRRQGVLAAAALVAVVALVAAALVGTRYLAGGDLRAALASSARDFNGVVEPLAAATSVDQVTTAAGGAEAAAGRVDSALDRLGALSGPEETSVRAQLEAETAVLVALVQLAEVGSDPLTSWGAAHADLTAALESERTSRAQLARFHQDAARSLADTDLMLTKVTAAVGPALVEDATAEATRLLTSLEAARTTADLRRLGDAAAPDQAAVAAAAQGLPSGEGKQVLTGYAAALDALSGLSKIDAESTGGWGGTRASLARTFGQVAAAAGSAGGASVRGALESALDSADEVVQKAAAAVRDWKAKTEAAVKARQSDLEDLQSYSSFFRSQAKTYEQLRQDLSTFTKRVEDPAASVSYYEGYTFLSQAAQDRQDVRDLMVGMDAPAGVRSAHQEVIGAVDRAIAAVQSAYDGLEQSQDCYYEDCPYYRDTPGWQRFQAESDAISKSYTRAMQRWEAAVAAEKVTVTNRALPAKPNV